MKFRLLVHRFEIESLRKRPLLPWMSVKIQRNGEGIGLDYMSNFYPFNLHIYRFLSTIVSYFGTVRVKQTQN